MTRRQLVKLLAALLPLSFFSSLALAKRRDEDFSNGDFLGKWQAITAGAAVIESPDISLTLPTIAENGAVVPVNIFSELQDLQGIWLLVEKNPTPLAAVFQLSPAVAVAITGRIKMAESCNVHLLAKQEQHWLHCQQWVRVMVGGCGTG